jgi:putative transposase
MFLGMREWLILVAHLIVTIIKVAAPGGARSVVAESLILKHQLLILNRSRKRAPKLGVIDRVLLGLGTLLISPRRLMKVALVIRPTTLLRFHRALVRRKYRQLFSSRSRGRPGPKGPADELIALILEMKRRNPRWGCPRIASQIAHAFGIEIDKDVVRRVLARYYRADPRGEGPSWLTLIAEASDSLWSVDLFRCESITMKSFWVMLVMDIFTRRLVGFGVQPAHKSFDMGPMYVKDLGKVAVVQGSVSEKSISNGKESSHKAVWMDVMLKRGNRWVVVRSQTATAR